MNDILYYFPKLSDIQQKQFAELSPLYKEWNEKINVISRKDIDNIYEHHILHSLSIGKELTFRDGSNILDFGTGGGFPGIPLAIMFPECQFKLIDRTGKKIKVVNKIASSIGLKNVMAEQISGEEERGKFDFVVSRAVMPLPDLYKIIRKNISKTQRNARPNGLICLKGGNLQGETAPFKNIVETTSIGNFFGDDWFKEKYLIYVPI